MVVKSQQMDDPKFWEAGRHPVLWFSFLGCAVRFGAGSWVAPVSKPVWHLGLNLNGQWQLPKPARGKGTQPLMLLCTDGSHQKGTH